jgi:hypothetical protein
MKIGDYFIPDSHLSTLLSQTKKIYEKIADEECTTEHIVPILGYAKRTNPFYRRITDLKAYGLIEHYKNKVRVTELSKQAILSKNEDKYEALLEIIRNIPLWSKLLDNYGENIEREKFATFLALSTNIGTLDAENIAESVRRAFEDDIRYINVIKKSSVHPALPGEEEHATERTITNSNVTGARDSSKKPIVHIQYPGVEIKIEDKASIEIAQKLLEAIILKMGLKEKE